MTSSENETYNLNNLCFLCLKYNKNVLYHVDNYLKVRDKLKYFLPEQILENIETPRYVCDNCVDRLDSINEFRKKCLDNIIIFKDYIKKFNQAPDSDKYLSETLTDIVHSRNSEIVNFENRIETPNCDQNVSESFEPIKSDENKEKLSGSSNIQQIFIKTEKIEDENIEEVSLKKEINEVIIKVEPFSYEDIPQEDYIEDIQSFDKYDVDNISREQKFNENSRVSLDEYGSGCDTSVKNSETEMDSDVSCASPELEECMSSAISNIPEKSKRQYEKTYQNFCVWRKNKNLEKISEKILLAYFHEKSKIVKSSTLWSTYSMLKCMLNIEENINIKKFSKLVPFLKKKSVGYRAKKSRVFTREQVNLFLNEAPDDTYLLFKVVLIMGIFGALRLDEITKLTVDNIQDVSCALIVKVPDTKSDIERTFVISNPNFIKIYQKYAALRPTNSVHRRLFLRYSKGKCTNQVVGVHKIAEIPSLIAKYLKLPNSEAYTGHCFRRTSATLTASANADISDLKLHSGWGSSTVKEKYEENSAKNKLNFSNKILEYMSSTTNFPALQPSTSNASAFQP